jgi:hypothetical protein
MATFDPAVRHYGRVERLAPAAETSETGAPFQIGLKVIYHGSTPQCSLTAADPSLST